MSRVFCFCLYLLESLVFPSRAHPCNGADALFCRADNFPSLGPDSCSPTPLSPCSSIKGLGKARVAAARKLGIRLWIMLRDQIDYQEFCRRGQLRQKNGGTHAGMPEVGHSPAM